MQLTQKWDKTFPQSTRVTHRKVTFTNRYGITLAADLYQPKSASGKQAGARRLWSVRRGEGAVVGPLCADDGGTRIRDAGFRSVLHRRERR